MASAFDRETQIVLRAKFTACAMSCAFRAATAYTLGCVAHASTHPKVSVSPGVSPM